MPIFRYLCKKCGAVTTKLVPRYDTPVACEACGAADTVKQPSAIAVGSTASSGVGCSHAHECAAASPGCGCGCGCGHHHG